MDFDNVMLAPVNKGILVRNSGRTDIRRLLTLTLEELRRISPIPIRMDSGGAPRRRGS